MSISTNPANAGTATSSEAGPAKAGPAGGTATQIATTLRGGEWLLKSSDPSSVFTPERLSEEHRLIAQTVNDFVDKEVLPVLDRLEEKDWISPVPSCGAPATSGCSAWTSPKHTAACRWTKSRRW